MINIISRKHNNPVVALLVAVLAISLPAVADEALHPSLQHSTLWSYATDGLGSKAIIGNSLIENGAARIAFQRVPRPSPQQNSWIELIYSVPGGDLTGVQTVTLHYQSSSPLLVKFSQRDYGGDGDGSYAHYQAELPAATEWTSQTVTPADFTRPGWTPANSADVGLILEHVNAIYLVPALDDATGGYTELSVKGIELEK